MQPLEIVRAIPSDAAELSEISRTAKAHWGYSAAALEEWREELTITAKYISTTELFKACAGRRTVGFYALHKSLEVWLLEHLWVLPASMGRGVGGILFRHAAIHAAALGATCLTIEADPNAEGFYLHMGARRAGRNRSQLEDKLREIPLLSFSLSRS